MLHSKYLIRPFLKKVSPEKLYSWLEKYVPTMLLASQTLGKIPYIGKGFKRLILVADYTNIYPLSKTQLLEWALLDTFDMLAPVFDNPQKASDAKCWFEQAGFVDINGFHSSHLVARDWRP